MKLIGMFAVLVGLLPSISRAELYRVEISSLTPSSAINTHQEQDGDGSYWTGVLPGVISEIVFEVPFPVGTKGLSSTTWFHSENPDPNSFIFTYVGRTDEDYRKLNTGELGMPYDDVVEDTSFGSNQNHTLFVKTVFVGELAKVFKTGAYVEVEIVPEPHLAVILFAFTLAPLFRFRAA